MEMKGEQMIAAPRERVWAALNDADILRQSIEGCESLEKTSDTSFVARVVARIGPVKAGFGGNITLTDIDAPNGYTLVGEGSGAGAGFAKGIAKVRLTDEGGSTRLSYEVHADVGGKLAQIGSRLIDATAKKQADSFFSRFGAIVAGGADAPGRAPAATTIVTQVPSGPGWPSAIIMIVMALIIGFLAGKIWG
jgi:carbon monoxide dehydrogenase subunit G